MVGGVANSGVDTWLYGRQGVEHRYAEQLIVTWLGVGAVILFVYLRDGNMCGSVKIVIVIDAYYAYVSCARLQ